MAEEVARAVARESEDVGSDAGCEGPWIRHSVRGHIFDFKLCSKAEVGKLRLAVSRGLPLY